MKRTTISLPDALRLLKSDKGAHDITAYRLTSGEVIHYPQAYFLAHHQRGGLVRLKLRPSNQIRALRLIALRSIDGLQVYL